jgi:hypothetical protein
LSTGDPGDHMYNQAKYGPVDFITGDYLAGKYEYLRNIASRSNSDKSFQEVNIANDAEAYRNGQHPGWVSTAWDGLCKSLDILNEKRIKVVINGGCLNPRGLAEKTHDLVRHIRLPRRDAFDGLLANKLSRR